MFVRPGLSRVLVADHGGGALRVRRWCAENAVEAVALVPWMAPADPDRSEGPFDYIVPVPADALGRWPDPAAVVSALHDAGCDGLHPGWGTAAHCPRLVEQLQYAGVAWAGPGREALGLALDRGVSLVLATELGIPVVPNSGPLTRLELARAWVAGVGFPVRIRPVDIEIGHPRPIMRSFEDFERAMPRWLKVGPCVLERQVASAREIEVPVLVDGEGCALAIGDRDVTVRDGRRHLVVEAPAPGLEPELRLRLARTAEAFARAVAWRGLGTVRFLLASDGRPYLLQLRPGLQPWHGATEAAYQVDLVDAQMRLAMRDPVRWSEDDIRPHHAAIWVGLTAQGSGVLEAVESGALRVDPDVGWGDAVAPGMAVAGVVATGPHRQAAVVRLRTWLDSGPIRGVTVRRAALDCIVSDPSWWRSPVDRDAAAAIVRGMDAPTGD